VKTNYETQRFTPARLAVVEEAERICTDYAAQGYSLTLRQLYYRFIAGDLLPESRRDAVAGTKNTEKNYKWLGDLVSRGRVGGMIDWNHITDRSRSTEGGDGGWDSPEAAAHSILDWYTISKWDGQPEYVEVWVEKEALSDVISRPAGRWNVSWAACKGNPSSSLVHDAARRLRRFEREGRKTRIIYLGDHDPTGVDINRDIQNRLELFRSTAVVDRIALNMDQVLELDPPPSPVKATDSRTSGYVDTYGTDECWELDAIEPAALDTLVEEAILSHLDRELWDARVEQESREKRTLEVVSDNWGYVVENLREQGYLDEEEE
jgi:hypothetical protein